MAFCSRAVVEAWRDGWGLMLCGSAKEELVEGSVDDEGAPGTSVARRAVWEGEARSSGDMVVGTRVRGGEERS